MSSSIRQLLRLSSVRGRLTFWYLLTLGASLSGFAVFVFLVRAHTLYRELEADLQVRAHEAASDLRPALLSLDIAAALRNDPRARAEAIIVRTMPDTGDFRSPSFPWLDWRGERQLAEAARNRTPLVTVVGDPQRGALRVATLVVDRPGTAPVFIQVAAPTAAIERILGQLAGTMIVAIMLVLGIAAYGSGVTTRRALAPVEEIVSRARQIQAQHLGERLEIQGGTEELDHLVATLNDMLGRIEGSVQSARRFAADASHELQTPLAAMRTIVEMWAREGCEGDDHRAMAADLLDEIDRLRALVRDLRLYTSADAGRLLEDAVAVDVAGITGDCCEIARAIAEEKQIDVEEVVRERPVVTGSPLHLRRVILNLVENAVRYSPPASTISISVASENGDAVIAVRDQGCGIERSDLPHIFEPFYRADAARSRDTGGVGLGLAIVDQIVRAHGGRVDVESTPGQGSTFAVHLPAA